MDGYLVLLKSGDNNAVCLTSPAFFCTFVETYRFMSTLELKTILIQRIAEIDDKPFLEAIKILLDTKVESATMQLSDKMVQQILASKKEAEEGLVVENALLEEEIEKWLKEK